MKNDLSKIALGGGCHWCTEAVFQSLKGVISVTQGYVASSNENSNFSEAIIVHYNSNKIDLKTLIEIHLHTHKSTSNHSMREVYRSAVYFMEAFQEKEILSHLTDLQEDFKETLITKALSFKSFKPSREEITNYYYKNPEKPFCKNYITPKLEMLLKEFSAYVDHSKLNTSH